MDCNARDKLTCYHFINISTKRFFSCTTTLEKATAFLRLGYEATLALEPVLGYVLLLVFTFAAAFVLNAAYHFSVLPVDVLDVV